MFGTYQLHYAAFSTFFLLLSFCAGVSERARAQGVIADLSKKDVPIEWNFTGTSILLFGAIDKKSGDAGQLDVVIVVRGPEESLYARRKQRIAGIWVNTKSKSFVDVPAYYSIVSTRPILQITDESDLEHMGIGLKALSLKLAQASGKVTEGEPDEYSQAVVRLMKNEGLYNEAPQGVQLIGNRLFRANIKLPANVPVGNFHADVYLFQNNKLASLSSLSLVIQKKGLERLIYSLAYQFPFFYGIAAVIISVVAGLIASAVFKDD